MVIIPSNWRLAVNNGRYAIYAGLYIVVYVCLEARIEVVVVTVPCTDPLIGHLCSVYVAPCI